eukprot:15459266-Alexandrium_andersonii.AAC.1
MQSAIRTRPATAAIRLNPQSAVRELQHRLRRSNLEPRGPGNDLESGLRSSRGVDSAPRSASESA